VEGMFKSDAKSAWSGIRQLTGMKKSIAKPDVNDVNTFCNELNLFYGRFDKHNFTETRERITAFHLDRLSEDNRVIISETDVLRSLNMIKAGKAAGPDKINGNILKLCRIPLSNIICKIYQQSLDNICIPEIWKTSEVIPLAKKASPECYNDYRPVALTSIIMKCLERIVKNVLCEQTKPYADCHQFAYTRNRCVEDATVSLTNYVMKHVDNVNAPNRQHFAKILFIDFSSAFNTIQPHILMQTLNNMNVNPYIILWINQFLTSRPQYVKYLNTQSDMITTNTGAPQGCVLSPLLFTIYTNNCNCNNSNTKLFKYADDTALVSRCVNEDNEYRNEVANFVNWCESNYLELNVKKTKEMIIDFRRVQVQHAPLYINNEMVEVVKDYKYLGTIIDDKFNFNANANAVFKKCQSRLYFVRQLSKLHIDNTILDLFYTATIQSVISFSLTCWFGSCSVESKNKLTKIVKNCKKLGVNKVLSIDELYNKCIRQRCKTILNDNTHPLSQYYKVLPSGKRLQSLKCRTVRYSNTFVPSSIVNLNKVETR
jgi:hypothetical protein